MEHLAAGRVAPARALAETWSTEAPGDVLALLALGETWEAAGERRAAARAYGSLIDLFPSRADLRRLAGERLERLGQEGLGLAIDTYQKAVLDRPDHPSGHRLLAWALLRAGRAGEPGRRALPSGRALLQPRPHGLRHGDPPDRPPRRQGRAHRRAAAVRGDGGPGDGGSGGGGGERRGEEREVETPPPRNLTPV